MRSAEEFLNTDDMNFTQKSFAQVNKHARKDGAFAVVP